MNKQKVDLLVTGNVIVKNSKLGGGGKTDLLHSVCE